VLNKPPHVQATAPASCPASGGSGEQPRPTIHRVVGLRQVEQNQGVEAGRYLPSVACGPRSHAGRLHHGGAGCGHPARPCHRFEPRAAEGPPMTVNLGARS
jgi:hypothetical protein